ncbi:glycosyltransferase [Aureimonas leprariae]|nr:glycosyltransferase [Aureimonas leprariae]
MLVADDRIDRRVLLEADSLAKAGAAVRVIALPYPGLDDRDAEAFPHVDIQRIALSDRRASRVRPGRAGGLSVFAPLLFLHHDGFYRSAIAKAADVVVAHDLPVLLTAALAADELGARLFFDAHELYPEQRQLPAWRRSAYRRLERRLLPKVDGVITVNASIAAELKRRGSRSLPAVILNLPLAARTDRPVSDDAVSLRLAFGIPPDTHLLLMHGSLSAGRNLEALVDAMALVEGHRAALVLLGPDGGIEQALRNKAESLGLLWKGVFFHPPVPQNALLATVATADIGIVPYREVDLNTRLCTPNKLFDFIAAGLPVLANNLPELRRFVVERGFGLNLPMHDARAMSDAIVTMLAADLPAISGRVAAAAPDFSWEAQEEEFLRLFDIGAATAGDPSEGRDVRH